MSITTPTPDEIALMYQQNNLIADQINDYVAKPVLSPNIYDDIYGDLGGPTQIFGGNEVISDAYVLQKMIDHLSQAVTYPYWSGYDITPWVNAINAGNAKLAENT